MNISCDKFFPDQPSRLKCFFALSRTPHALMDMATPIFSALLSLGYFPSLYVLIVGLITAFSGYTAVYALNDLVDFRTDLKKVQKGGYKEESDFIDGIWIRHPIAKGVLPLQQALIWTSAWTILALTGAFLLNPVCVIIFVVGCLLEVAYCLLWKVSPYRSIFNGLVKTCGAVAAVFAVDHHPSPLFMISLVLWIFFWEIGGQNIPNDWTDVAEDKDMQAKTIPVAWGLNRSIILILMALIISMFFNILTFISAAIQPGVIFLLSAVVLNIYHLIYPAYRLYDTHQRTDVIRLFNKSSYFPISICILTLIHMIFV